MRRRESSSLIVMVAKKAIKKEIIKNDPATDEVLTSEHWSKDTCSVSYLPAVLVILRVHFNCIRFSSVKQNVLLAR